MDYLKNSICKFTPLFPLDYSTKKNIVSVVFFKMKDSGYKSFERYVQGIQYLSKYIARKLPNFKIRLFIDNTIHEDKEIMSYLQKFNNIELVLFDCPGYKYNNFHRGTFGTLIRFFPMFDFENNDANHILICDIDWRSHKDIEERFRIYNTYQILKKNNYLDNLHLFIDGTLNHLGEKYIYLEELKTVCPYLIGGYIINTKKIPNKVIEDFIPKVDTTENILSNYKNKEKTLIAKSQNKKFIYGIDEYFLNKILVPFLEKNKLEFGAKIKFGITDPIYYKLFEPTTEDSFAMREKIPEKDEKILKEIFSNVLNNIDDFKYTNIKDAFSFMDNYTYFKNIKGKNLSKEQNLIFARLILSYIHYFDKNYFDKHKMEFIFQNIETIYIDKFVFFFSRKKTIIFEKITLDPRIKEVFQKKIKKEKIISL